MEWGELSTVNFYKLSQLYISLIQFTPVTAICNFGSQLPIIGDNVLQCWKSMCNKWQQNWHNKSLNKRDSNFQICYKLLNWCCSCCHQCCHPGCCLWWLLSPSLLSRDWPLLTNERAGWWASDQSEARVQPTSLCSPCILSLPISPLSNPISFQSKQGEIQNTEAKLSVKNQKKSKSSYWSCNTNHLESYLLHFL